MADAGRRSGGSPPEFVDNGLWRHDRRVQPRQDLELAAGAEGDQGTGPVQAPWT